MSNGIYAASAGAVAQTRALDVTANNIANATTTGFHGDRVTFREALTRASTVDLATVVTGSTRIDTQAGAIHQTGNPLDLALEGDGFFAITTPSGARYTRAGNLQLDDSGTLVTGDGFKVRAEGGATITIPPESKHILVGTDGSINVDGEDVGKLELVTFAANQIKREGDTFVSATGRPQAGDPPKVRAGMLESSNVNVVRGVVDLVKVSRIYESLMRIIQGYHDVESRAARELGGPK